MNVLQIYYYHYLKLADKLYMFLFEKEELVDKHWKQKLDLDTIQLENRNWF